MSTEEREESQPRPRKVIPSIRRENTDQEGERRPYNQGYNRPEGNNYERRPYDRPSRDDRGGYNSYGDNRSSYGDRPSRPRTYDNREGGGYNSRPSYNNRGGYGNNREGGYGNNREGGYNSNRDYYRTKVCRHPDYHESHTNLREYHPLSVFFSSCRHQQLHLPAKEYKVCLVFRHS